MPHLRRWAASNRNKHQIELLTCVEDASGGDILFLVSCSEKVMKAARAKYRNTLVLHASDLPKGRGWSPHVWDIVEGADTLTISLLEAEDVIDSGRIWKKQKLDIAKHMLWDEINVALFEAEVALIDFAVANADKISPFEQDNSVAPSYRRRRNPEDSSLDPERSISEQFDLLRICDPERFPAFFDHLGHRYVIKLEKVDE